PSGLSGDAGGTQPMPSAPRKVLKALGHGPECQDCCHVKAIVPSAASAPGANQMPTSPEIGSAVCTAASTCPGPTTVAAGVDATLGSGGNGCAESAPLFIRHSPPAFSASPLPVRWYTCGSPAAEPRPNRSIRLGAGATAV